MIPKEVQTRLTEFQTREMLLQMRPVRVRRVLQANGGTAVRLEVSLPDRIFFVTADLSSRVAKPFLEILQEGGYVWGIGNHLNHLEPNYQLRFHLVGDEHTWREVRNFYEQYELLLSSDFTEVYDISNAYHIEVKVTELILKTDTSLSDLICCDFVVKDMAREDLPLRFILSPEGEAYLAWLGVRSPNQDTLISPPYEEEVLGSELPSRDFLPTKPVAGCMIDAFIGGILGFLIASWLFLILGGRF